MAGTRTAKKILWGLFWTGVAAACFSVVLNAEFVLGDEYTYLNTLCKGILRPLAIEPEIGRCYPFTHWDCNFVFWLPSFARANLPLTLYFANMLILAALMLAFVSVLRQDRCPAPADFAVVQLAGLALLVSPAFLETYWWNIFPESRMMLLEAVFLLAVIRGSRTDGILAYGCAILSMLLILGYKETGFVPGTAFACAMLVFSWRSLTRRARIAYAGLVGIGIAYCLGYYLLILPQVTCSYRSGRTGGLLSAAIFYFKNPFLLGAFLLACWRFYELAVRRDRRHVLWDAALFAGMSFVLAYIALGMTMTYYVVPAFVFLIPAAAHWGRIILLSASRKVGFALGALAVAILAVNLISAVGEGVAFQWRRQNEVGFLRNLAHDPDIRRILYYVAPSGEHEDYFQDVITRYFEYAGGDTNRIEFVSAFPQEIREDEIVFISPNVRDPYSLWSNLPVIPFQEGWYSCVRGYPPPKWKGSRIDVEACCSSIRGVYSWEGWGRWGGREVVVRLDLPEVARRRALHGCAQIGALVSRAHPTNGVSVLVNGQKVAYRASCFPPQLVAFDVSSSLTDGDVLQVSFVADACVNPRDEKVSVDGRDLGVAFKSLSLEVKK